MKHLYRATSAINGSGLYTNKKLDIGDHVGFVHGPIHVIRTFTPTISQKILNWIGVGRYSWIETTKSDFRAINHSCDPNVAIPTKRKVVAIKNIPADTELTMDYSLTDAELGWSIDCSCGSKDCRGKIGPIQTLPKSFYLKHEEHIATNFKKIYLSS
jgi:hypothetical protein